MSTTERNQYLIHIRRLQAENRDLKLIIADERIRRQRAFAWYFRRLKSRWYSTMDMFMYVIQASRN